MKGILAALVVAVCATASPAAMSGSRLVAQDTSISFGVFAAEANVAQSASLPLIVFSDKAWELSVTYRPQPGLGHTSYADQLFIRTGDGEWLRLSEGVPVTVATGLHTTDAGEVITASLQLITNLDSGAGERHGSLNFGLTGADAPLPVDVDFRVLPTLSIRETGEEELGSIEPTIRGTYPFLGKTYLVRTNVPWECEVFLRTPFAKKTDQKGLGQGQVLVTTADGSRSPLKPDHRLKVARGKATGEEGAIVELQLALANSTLEIEGRYSGEVDVVVSSIGQ